MQRLTPEEFEERAILYALGVLNTADRAQFEAERQERGEEGERMVASARRAVARAGLGSGSTTGPAEREALAAVTERPLARDVSPIWVAALVLAALLCVGTFAWGIHQRGRVAGLESAREAAAGRADSLASLLATRDSAAASQPGLDEILPVILAADAVFLPLEGVGGAQGRLVAGSGGALLVASGLPSLPQGSVYRLWHQGEAAPREVGALGSAPAGVLLRLLPDGGLLEGWGALIVTAEPATGSPLPTGGAVLEYRGRLR